MNLPRSQGLISLPEACIQNPGHLHDRIECVGFLCRQEGHSPHVASVGFIF